PVPDPNVIGDGVALDPLDLVDVARPAEPGPEHDVGDLRRRRQLPQSPRRNRSEVELGREQAEQRVPIAVGNCTSEALSDHTLTVATSAVVGSIVARTSMTLSAGKPPQRACSRMMSALSAT